MEYVIALEFLCIVVLYRKIRGQKEEIKRLQTSFDKIVEILRRC